VLSNGSKHGFAKCSHESLNFTIGLGPQRGYTPVPESKVGSELCKLSAIEWWSIISFEYFRHAQ
jgi:hypothetical protein